jgi:hypothetical protein
VPETDHIFFEFAATNAYKPRGREEREGNAELHVKKHIHQAAADPGLDVTDDTSKV